MAKHLFVVFTNAGEGKDEEFNTWYDNVHGPAVIGVPGIVNCQRFELSDAQFSLSKPSPWKYLALYEIETDDLAKCLQTLTERIDAHVVPMSDMMDPNFGSWVYHPRGALITKEK
jgi:hypothetical protein